ncbi:phosphopyruvate hydratase [Metamycoplasma hyosynoviae]|uniref:phosphopyruvate hydratase n=1 Tax=Metamycoplasma hyosynoviae TaxID=29559 RepID=UPI00235A3259|nr:phosphopyruvate hydratase [Metamycoplasma hyosynoviae]MDC8921709.1 phosphopyruvate hydratase [Metamycoplasma hyosynoviae]MDD1373213.1 phosphopyruvate hydratase [Metamycoplasma hyosynoviae]MDD1373541.1 phosphopyruvate hydratase [Metamycoplasma hyosynoviae]MDD1375124.1 phosphopyruvate hydratase [Metamycoplasma hyosynoviae]MDD1375750.1 phosphopyruvate hydratase [Metamycoplasma hyosynoviae]
MSKIVKINAYEVLDSRGNPTVKVELTTEKAYAEALVPSGASTGSKEALELRDKGTKYEKNWFGGKGVQTAVDNVNNIIAKKLIGKCSLQQAEIDKLMIELDGTPTKSKLGANAILGVSLAVAKAAAIEKELPLYEYLASLDSRKAYKLPVPMLNVINGGEHASNTIDFQEFMIMPLGAKTFKEALQVANFVFHTLAKLLKKAGHGTQVGDEGGFAPNLHTHEEALEFLVNAIKEAGFMPATSGDKAVAIALDAASSELYCQKSGKYIFKKFKNAIETNVPGFEKYKAMKYEFTSDEFVEYYGHLISQFPIISIEDSHDENDWQGFANMVKKFGDKVQLVGDDLIVTNPHYIKEAIQKHAINASLIKINQIGTVSETIDAIKLTQNANMIPVVSHRSGETEDTFIADLAVAFNTGEIKTGSLSRTDRIAKYNRLLKIEAELGKNAKYEGRKAFTNLK